MTSSNHSSRKIATIVSRNCASISDVQIIKTVMDPKHAKQIESLAGRIRFLRVTYGMKPAELAAKVGKQTGKKITPEAVRKWEKPAEEGGVKNLEAANLYALADIFDINARWIALGPKNSPIRPVFPTMQEMELLDLFRQLNESSRAAFLSLGKQIRASQLNPTA